MTKHLSISVAAASAAVSASSAFGYSAELDFSTTMNPNGVWSFGSETTLGTGFTLATVNAQSLGIDFWSVNGAGAGYLPGAFKNNTGSTIFYGSAIMDPGMLGLHPGSAGEFSLARFTAAASGFYQFSADFIGHDPNTTTDVHLLKNGVSLFNDTVTGYLDLAASGTFTMFLLAGDTLDAAVGFGTNHNYYGDTTKLDFNVTLTQGVPLPTGAALGFAGLAGLTCVRRRRA